MSKREEKREKVKAALKEAPQLKSHRAQRPEVKLSREIEKGFAISLMLVGLVCVVLTDYFHHAFPYILGCIMAGIGSVDIYRGYITEEYKRKETKVTSNGIVFLILGLVILFSRENAYSVIGSVWGVFGLVKGSEELNETIYHKTQKNTYKKELIAAIIEIILGILLLLDPVGSLHHHIIILGLELMVEGWNIMKESEA